MKTTPIERIDEKFVKCDRCGRTRKLFQYTHFEADRWIDQVKIIPRDENGNTRTTERINLAQCRGLCEECAVTVNSERYDRENDRRENCGQFIEKTATGIYHCNEPKGHCPIHDTPQPVTDWREEFKRQFGTFSIWNSFAVKNVHSEEIMAFIEKLLDQTILEVHANLPRKGSVRHVEYDDMDDDS